MDSAGQNGGIVGSAGQNAGQNRGTVDSAGQNAGQNDRKTSAGQNAGQCVFSTVRSLILPGRMLGRMPGRMPGRIRGRVPGTLGAERSDLTKDCITPGRTPVKMEGTPRKTDGTWTVPPVNPPVKSGVRHVYNPR